MDENDGGFSSKFNERYSILTRKITRMLSEDSRMSVLEMSKALGISRRTIKEKIKKAEEELQIRYTLELNSEVLKMNNAHLIMIKFYGKPDYEEIKRVLMKSYIPQIVVLTKGTFDMLIFANAITSNDYVYWDKTTQVMFSKYGVLWQSSDIALEQLGFFPTRNEFIERLGIPQKEKDMLKLLNANSRISFREISEKLNMHFNTVAYNFNKLVEQNYIKRFTLVMTPPKDITLMAMLGKYVLSENFEKEASQMRKTVTFADDPYSLISRIFLSNQLVGSYDYFSFGAFDNTEMAMAKDVKYYKKLFKRHRVKVMYGELTKVLIGDLPLRSLETAKVHHTIKWTAPD